MATVDQKVRLQHGGRPRVSKHLTLVMVAGATVDATTDLLIPTGATDFIFRYSNAVAFTGSPTNINLTIGNAAGDARYVAALDAKAAAGYTLLTQANTNVADLQLWPAAGVIHATLTAVGGTNPAGTVLVQIEYTPPDAVS